MLIYHDSNSQSDYPIELVKVIEGRGLTYEANAFTALDVAVNAGVPNEYYLSQNYPNPFNSLTRLDYGLPEATNFSIKLFDMNGRLAATIIAGKMNAGYHSAIIDGSNLSSGIYCVKMESKNFKAIRKIVMIN